ncbi:hypothetical protein IVS31_09025, partial [Lactiplantibacillus plantarum]|nr:hypothetical protein [Lactiplantibacillus plantarum]MBR7626386.1 hypothetical protein [Lactiplantibacillus plantarum]MBR7644499.1 hypothetical protein [Lactiplantibacillus plantarum]MBR7664915.1 hypothetical protein [Lactiplantibacillus plantarum]MCZ9359718.1 hypothetical protein [Lactiplantibacillus plantarum]
PRFVFPQIIPEFLVFRQSLVDPDKVVKAPQPVEADLAVLQFKYDQLMADPTSSTAAIQALRQQIDRLKA